MTSITMGRRISIDGLRLQRYRSATTYAGIPLQSLRPPAMVSEAMKALQMHIQATRVEFPLHNHSDRQEKAVGF